MPIEDRYYVRDFIKNHGPFDALIHLAAMTSIPPCEQDPDKAFRINVHGTRNVVEEAVNANPNCYIMHASTPCIFPGRIGDMYDEDSHALPKNMYGLTKYVSELMVQLSTKNHLIFRANFVPYARYAYPKAFSDRYGTYLFAHQVAEAIVELLEKRIIGIVHIVGEDKISMHDLARMCPDSTHVKPMTIDDYEGNHKLTMNMSMSTKYWHPYKIRGTVI